MQATARRLSVVSATSTARRRLIRDVRLTSSAFPRFDMSQEQSPATPPTELTPHQHAGRKLLVRGTWAYYAVIAVPILTALVGGLGLDTIASRLAVAVCIAIAPIMAWRGSEGWKHVAGVVGLFLAMSAFAGGCAAFDPSTRTWGFVSLAVFFLSCYIVKVFLINQTVKDFMPTLRAGRQKSIPTPPPA